MHAHVPRRVTDAGLYSTLGWAEILLALDFALNSLWRARRRIALAVLGVGIGFAAIHTLLIIGHSAEARIQASLDSLGGDIVTLSITHRASDGVSKPDASVHRAAGPGAVGLSTALRLLRAMPGVQAIAPVERACFGGSRSDGLEEVTRVSLQAQPLLGIVPASGRLLHAGDRSQGNVVLGADTFQSLRRQQPQARLGATVGACGRQLRIVGILQRHPGSDLVQAISINRGALILSDDASAEPQDGTRHILVRLNGGADSRLAAQQLRDRLASLLPNQTVAAAAAWDVIQLRQEQTALYTRFLAALGSISLLVGAMGISNMMLVTVAERRSEIGLRMAIGARRRDVVLQFVAEGVLICLIGSATGLLLGIVAAKVALGFAGFEFVFPGTVALHATLLALVCGIAAAAYPAYRAATVDPNQSLRGDTTNV